MNKTEIIKCLHSSMAEIERRLGDEELSYIREEITYESIMSVEMIEKNINEPKVKYHEALRFANEWVSKYQEMVARLRARFKKEGKL